MEILLNNKFYSVRQFGNRLAFMSLSTEEKIELEKWWKLSTDMLIADDMTFKIEKPVVHKKIKAYLVTDSKISILSGVQLSSIGDASSDYWLIYDFEKRIGVLDLNFIKQFVESEEDNAEGIIPN